MQAADLCGVGTLAMKAMFEDIEANAEQPAGAAIAALPNGFPDQLVTSTLAAISHRVRLVADLLSRTPHV
ncbi:hypothetical protein CU100_15985 [Phyllobacterium endophyticum]|uniref:Uncharacterized protein n=2 Tax=Phyllobacterium endophyticum TaxID=1149773 RepID=A0A2P7ARH9_9HYPH|nr:hypothetical protein CU100_15985 [Phyllobacterium endophyticum]